MSTVRTKRHRDTGALTRRECLRMGAVSLAACGLPRLLYAAPNGHATQPATSLAGTPPGGAYTLVDLPDPAIVEAYRHAAVRNVLAAVNPKVFFGYWSVCADGQGFGYGCTYPSLDGHQLTDALLCLDQVDVVKANWDYVRTFQRPNGQLPIAVLKGMKEVGGKPLDPNGGLYTHWVPGDPLRALGGTTYIQNADVIFRRTRDEHWLAAQLESINRAADFLGSLTTAEGRVGGAGYYIERPTRIEYDGVTQGHAADAFERAAALNRLAGDERAARRYGELAERITAHFRRAFWAGDHCVEYIHPERGPIAHHGLTDVDWTALATGIASPQQQATLWPALKDEKDFHYGGMPTGISTRPQTYEKWESTTSELFDLAAMGRTWYLECWARARMNDGDGIVDTLRRVARAGREGGYYWRERYHTDGKGGYSADGAQKYCEYPANFIRIVQRFVLGVEHRLDGSLALAPNVPAGFWDAGFGQTISWPGRTLSYRMRRDQISGAYTGTTAQRVCVRFQPQRVDARLRLSIDGQPSQARREDRFIVMDLPAAGEPCRFVLAQESA